MRASDDLHSTPLPMLAFLLLHVPEEKWCALHLNCPEGLTRPISGTDTSMSADTGEI